MTTATLPGEELDQEPQVPRRRRGLAVVLVVVLALGGFAAREWWTHRPGDIRAGTTLVDEQGLAAKYGIDVNLIAVTAAGGMIEFRYQVVDPDKADRIVHDPALAPALVVEATGETLVMNSPPHHHGSELQLGGTYFFLMANAHNAVHRGSELTLVIGEARIPHITAEG